MRRDRMNPKSLRLQVLLEDELVARLDEWRVAHMPLKSRSQAIARLIEKGMAKEEPD
jgi:metal-responsive CopG/Arc/MetJ family transcriptional regulator